MGEGSGGRSATLPTFFKFRSSRTRIEWQKGQTVWTALDQRNVTGAPQLGQFAWGWLIDYRAGRDAAPRPTSLRIPAADTRQNPNRGADGSRIHSSTTNGAPGKYDRRCAIPEAARGR